jgi:CRP-like cAMP-binding protein
MVALVCRCRRAHEYPVLSPSGNRALATGSLGARVHRDESVSDCAPLSRTASGRALRGRTEALRSRVYSIRPREFVSLSLVGEWKNAEPGKQIVAEGEPVSSVCIAITGSAEVRKQGERIGTLRPGHIIGNALALTGDPSPVEMTFTEPARYMSWSLPNLRRFMEKRPDLRVTLQSLVSRDLARKLETVLS